METVVLAGAESDLFEAWKYYEELIPGLGDRFDHAIREAFNHLAKFPASAPDYKTPFKRFLIRRFSHCIFYRLHGGRLVIVAVLSLKQNPDSIQQRLGQF